MENFSKQLQSSISIKKSCLLDIQVKFTSVHMGNGYPLFIAASIGDIYDYRLFTLLCNGTAQVYDKELIEAQQQHWVS